MAVWQSQYVACVLLHLTFIEIVKQGLRADLVFGALPSLIQTYIAFTSDLSTNESYLVLLKQDADHC